MIIRRIRLKNVKSFGTGPDGNGVTIHLDRGLNRVGGRNGAGKSTIIEALGFALFNAEPVRGDNRIRVETYLVRSGCKTGEVDIWIEAGDCLYRIERDVGQVIRRWKVAREDDQFIEAEGEKEVCEWMARFFGLPHPGRLSEVFHGLVGVKQGRFTRPFDCTPRAARDHFDPLLDVDIFRQCFDELLEPVQLLKNQKSGLEVGTSGLSGQMEQLRDAPERLAAAGRSVNNARNIEAAAAAKVADCQKTAGNWENALSNKNAAEQKVAAARAAWGNAQMRLKTAEEALLESQKAQTVLRECGTDYSAYRKAEMEHREGEKARMRRDSLRQREAELSAQLAGAEQEQIGWAEAARRSMEQAELKGIEAAERGKAVEARIAALDTLAVSAREAVHISERYASWLEKADRWGNGPVAKAYKQYHDAIPQLQELAAELAAAVPEELAAAEEEMATARGLRDQAQIALAAAEERGHNLNEQFRSISGGHCPFIKERCAQLDPERVQGQISAADQETEQCRRDLQQAVERVAGGEERLARAQRDDRARVERASAWRTWSVSLVQAWNGLNDPDARESVLQLQRCWPGPEIVEPMKLNGPPQEISEWVRVFENLRKLAMELRGQLEVWRKGVAELQRESRTAEGQVEKEKGALEAEAAAVQTLAVEADNMRREAQQQKERCEASKSKASLINAELGAVRSGLDEFAELDDQMIKLRQLMDGFRETHDRYVQHEAIAARMEERQTAQKQAVVDESAYRQACVLAEASLDAACAAYSEGDHVKAKNDLQNAHAEYGMARSRVEQASVELDLQSDRARRLEELSTLRKENLREIDRIQASLAVLEKARSVLKNAQGLVAAGLTGRIRERAQAVLNAMSPEPVRLEWEPEDYRLTLHTATGPRRFAQLSGGQQMKAAIAMHLALVKEFSAAGFCAFDEPTYGLDSESRALLADAILGAQTESRFEQLLVVSHDEAFDDKVEHLIDLDYSPVSGTRVIRR